MAMQGIIALYTDDVKRSDHDKAARMLAYYFNKGDTGSFELGELPMAAFDVDETMGERMFLPEAEGFTSNVPELMAGAWTAGSRASG